MYRSPCFGVWVMALASCASAQLSVQSPFPTGRNLGGAAFNSPAHGFVVGDNHHLIETNDAGLTWTRRVGTGFSTDPFYTAAYADPSHLYIAGNNQDAYRSIDGGVNFTQMNTFPAGSARVFDFVTPTTGYIGLNGAICWTPDGGATWPLRSGYPDCPIMFGLDFRDADLGVACGIRSTPHNDGGIYRTIDGGQTWALVHEGNVNDVIWIDQQTAIAMDGLDVIRSDDAGLTWFVINSGWITTGAIDLDRAGESFVLGAVSAAGDVWTSPDLGFSWFQVVEGIGVLPANWMVHFSDESHGWVVGANGLTYRTTDAGATYQLMNSGCGDEVMDIDFAADDTFGIAVTHRGFVFRTEDRGGRWEVDRLRVTGIVFGREEGLRAVQVLNSQTVFTGGAGGVFFRSDDAGRNWQPLGYPASFPGNFEIRDIEFKDELKGWAVGFYADPSVYRTDDGGYNWTPVPEIGGSMVAVDVKDTNIRVATAGSRVYRSTNNGDTWTFATVPGDGYGISDMEFADAANGWVVGWYGTMAKTTNGGVSWITVPQTTDETYLDISLNGPTDLWVVGYNHATFRHFYMHSTNGGASWTRMPLNQYEESFNRILARPAGRYWLVGSTGRIVYSAAPPMQITVPGNTPAQVPPLTPTPFAVRIVPGEEAIVPGTEMLWVRRRPGGEFEAYPLGPAPGEGEDYVATLPALACGDAPEFYLSAQGSLGTVVRLPAGAPASTFSVNVGVFEVTDLARADFDAGLPAGWTATGMWHVTSACAPPGTCDSGSTMYFGQDSTCNFETGQRVSGVLASPTMSLPLLQPGQDITVSFCSALDTEYPDNAYGDDDQAQLWFVWGSGLGQAAPINWFTDHSVSRVQTFSVNLHAGRTGRFEWRFDTMNTYMNAFRGWHVDNIRVSAPALVCRPACSADFNADGFVNSQDFFDFLAPFFEQQPSADINTDGFVNSQDYFDFLSAFFAGC